MTDNSSIVVSNCFIQTDCERRILGFGSMWQTCSSWSLLGVESNNASEYTCSEEAWKVGRACELPQTVDSGSIHNRNSIDSVHFVPCTEPFLQLLEMRLARTPRNLPTTDSKLRAKFSELNSSAGKLFTSEPREAFQGR